MMNLTFLPDKNPTKYQGKKINIVKFSKCFYTYNFLVNFCSELVVFSPYYRSAAKRNGERLRNKARKKSERNIKALEKELARLQRKLWRLQKRNARRSKNIPSPQLSPQAQVKRIVRGKCSQDSTP